MNFKRLCADFPIFGTKSVPKELVYLDSAATSQKPQAVIDALTAFYTHDNATVHRVVHDLGEQVTTKYEAVRQKVAQFIGAAHADEIVFTSGTTAGINMAAESWARANLQKGDEILITQAEHHANFLPWQRLAQQTGVTVRTITIHPERFVLGCTNPEHQQYDDGSYNYTEQADATEVVCAQAQCDYFDSLITPNTKLVAVSMYSNVLGNIWDEDYTLLKQLIERAHAQGAKVLLDVAQVIGHQPFNVQEFPADFVVFSAHKALGPTGLGVLYINRAVHNELVPYHVGGGMVYSVGATQSSWQKMPHMLEAGTPSIAAVIGFGAALDYMNETFDFELMAKHRASLCSALIGGLQQIDGVTILGNIKRLMRGGHIVQFSVAHHHAHDVASYLSMHGIAVRAGHHCAQPLMEVLGVEASVRVSIHAYNNVEDIERLLEVLRAAVRNE